MKRLYFIWDQELDAILLANVKHVPCGSLVEQGEANLIGQDRDSARTGDSQVCRIKIGQADMFDPALLL
jgi:hypothetical protein